MQTINVFATDTINFELKALDLQGDSVFITHSGNIFQDATSIIIDPPYAMSIDTSGIAAASTSFKWITGCQHISASPYKIRYEASDNGCPLKMISVRKFDINVLPPPNVAKSNLLCLTLLDNNNLKITRVSDTAVSARYFNHFTLFRSVNGSAFSPLKNINETNPVEIYDSSAFENRINDYCYVLSAFNTCGMESERSDTLCSVSHINTHKNYIESVSVIAENNVQLKWEPFNAGPYAVYYIYKESDADATMQLVQTISNYQGSSWNDFDALTGKHSYCYAMINEDVCGNVSDTSLRACSILLKGASSLLVNSLSWTPYINWSGGVDHYDVLRKSAANTSGYEIAASLPKQLIYFDRDMPISSGTFNYIIKATEGAGGNNATSESNEIILNQAPLIFIPSAFTPNNDGVNDYFLNQGSFVEEFEFIIYNRWGQRVFNTGDLHDHWDGKFNGKLSPSGVYFYKLKFKGYDDKNITERTGSITLLR